MKTLFIGLMLSLMITTTKAQTEKGRWTLQAQIGNLSYAKQSGGRSLSISTTPSAGYFITNGLALGIGIPVSIQTQRSTQDIADFDYRSKSSSVGFSPFARYFVGQGKLKPYVGISYSYNWVNYSNSRTTIGGSYSTKSKGTNTALIPTLGLAYFPNQHLGLIAGLNYNIYHDTQDEIASDPTNPTGSPGYTSNYRSLSLGIGFQLFIGR